MIRLFTTIILIFFYLMSWSWAEPKIFYTDIVEGPNTGWENGDGCYLSIFGSGFGSTIGDITVTVGGGTVAQKIYLGVSQGLPDTQQLSVQLGSACASGDIVVTVGGESDTAPETFTVVAGDVYYISTSGNDGTGVVNDITHPYRTANAAKALLTEYDTLCVLAGTYDLSSGNENLYSGRWISLPVVDHIAIIGYPGAFPIIDYGDTVGNVYNGIRTPPDAAYRNSYCTISGLKFNLKNTAGTVFLLGNYLLPTCYFRDGRIVNILVTGGMRGSGAVDLPSTYSGVNPIVAWRSEGLKFYGNDIGNNNALSGCESHAIYVSHAYTNMDFAYNYLHDNEDGGRGFLQLAGDESLTLAVSSVDDGTDTITMSSAHGWPNGTNVMFYTQLTGLPPSPCVRWQQYYVVNASGADLQLSNTLGGGAINLTDTGSTLSSVFLFPASYPGSDYDTSGLYCWGNNSNVTIRNNRWVNIPTQAILFNLGSQGPFYVYNNLFENCNVLETYYPLSFRGAWRNGGEYYLWNNTEVNGNGTQSIIEVGNSNYPTWPEYMEFKNNIFHSSELTPIYNDAGTGNVQISTTYPVSQNNIWYCTNGSGDGSQGTAPAYSVFAGTGDSLVSPSSDTIFNDYSGGDFSLSATSPAIDAAQVLNSEFLTDFYEILRGASWDIGAIEYAPSTAPVVTAPSNTTQSETSYTISGASYILESGRVVSSCTWSNNQGGSDILTASGGSITGTITGLTQSTSDVDNVITITVTDDQAESGSDTFTITVQGTGSTNPVLTIDQQSQTVSSSTISITGSETHESGRTIVSCTWSNDQGGSGSLTVNSGVISGSVTGMTSGANVITFTLTDSESETDIETRTFTYSPPATGSATSIGSVSIGCVKM